MEELITILEKLQELRKDTPVFMYCGPIHPKFLYEVREILLSEQFGDDKGKEIDIILHSSGGGAEIAYGLIKSFREKYADVNIIVPQWAKSAATLFAFGGTRLVMHAYGELGPIDAQIKKDDESDPEGGWASALNVQASLDEIKKQSIETAVDTYIRLRTKKTDKDVLNKEILKIGRKPLIEMLLSYSANLYRPLLENIDTEEVGSIARSLALGNTYAERLLREHSKSLGKDSKPIDEDKMKQFLDYLTYDCPDHGYVVDYQFLKDYLPNVIKADQSPYSKEYYKELEKLSNILFPLDPDKYPIVNFVKNLRPKQKVNNSTEKKENNPNEQQPIQPTSTTDNQNF